MRTNITILLLLIFPLLFQNQSFSQDSVYINPTYTLTATNIIQPDANTYEWDVYLLHINPNVTPFIYASAQYFFNFNINIALPGDSLRYSIVSSQLPAQYRPVGASISGNILRLASNGPGTPEESPVISSVSPGTRVLKLRLKNYTRPFQPYSLGLQWRSEFPNPFTRIYAFTGLENAEIFEISNPLKHFIDTYISPQLISPEHNTINMYTSINFIWSKVPNTLLYQLQISSDSLFNSYFYNDSTLADTNKFINGLSVNTKYFWRVGKKDTLGNKYFSLIWNFRTLTTTVMNINLTILPEGKYNSTFNILSQRDTINAYLRNSSPPFNIVDSTKGVIDTINFSQMFSFYNAPTSTYYISIKNKQCIETWSKSGGESLINNGVPVYYDFTTAITQAYGNNLKSKGSKFCIYSGDINQDGFITLFDVIPVYNNAVSFNSGYQLLTDLNGDLIVDLTDVTLCYNNSTNFIGIKRP